MRYAGYSLAVCSRQAARNRCGYSPGGEVLVTDGPYLETKELVGGFWVLEAADPDEALVWGRKAAIACRGPVAVRPFH